MRPPPFALLIALAALPVTLLAGMGDNGMAAADVGTGSSDGPMALHGQVLVETVGKAMRGHHMVREAPVARSGDRLIFLIRYHNISGGTLPGYDVIAPVAQGVHILPGRTEDLRISVDGGRNWSRPDSANAMAPTHVRLHLDHAIAPGETGTVAYRGLLL